MPPYEIAEVELIITPDGERYYLNDGLMSGISSIGGRGMPGISYDTFQGYQQPYPVPTGWKLEPRSVVLTLIMTNTTRADYWQNRHDLMQALRFNRGGPFTLRHIRADGTRRDLYCYPESAPVFPDDLSLWAGEEIEISLIAHDPLFKDASETFEYAQFTLIEELVFPATFPISFRSGTYSDTIAINYEGTFTAYPIIEILGPYTWLSMQHVQTGAFIKLIVPIAEGEVRRIDLTPRSQAIEDGSGNDKFSELQMPESNLITFNIRPKGAAWRSSPFEGVPNGLNSIWFQGQGVSSNTAITFRYNSQYIDIA